MFGCAVNFIIVCCHSPLIKNKILKNKMLNIIQGKPGSGKSYFAVKKIVDLLINLVEDEKRSGTQSVRRVYTNIKLNLIEIDSYVENVTFSGIKASKYIQIIDNSFFWVVGSDGVNVLCDWWEKFSDGAFIVIDEVQYYLASNSTDKKSEGYNKKFELYISTHRHKAQDIIFITQHQDNILRSCLSMSEGTWIITNYKNFILPWLGIPLSDFDVVRRAWGSDHQFANVQYGLFVGRAFHKQSSEVLLLEDSIFKLYKSHNDNISEDRPNLKLGRFSSLFWLFRRHALQLSFKFILVFVFIFALFSVFRTVPSAFGRLFGTGSKSLHAAENLNNVQLSNQDNVTAKPISLLPKIVTVFKESVVLENGSVVRVGEEFNYENKRYKLVSVDFDRCSFRLACVSTEQNADSVNE